MKTSPSNYGRVMQNWSSRIKMCLRCSKWPLNSKVGIIPLLESTNKSFTPVEILPLQIGFSMQTLGLTGEKQGSKGR